jgi:hypothetical protein
MVRRLNPGLEEVVDEGREALMAYELQVGPLHRDDWEAAFARIHPQTTGEELRRFEAWGRQVESAGSSAL